MYVSIFFTPGNLLTLVTMQQTMTGNPNNAENALIYIDSNPHLHIHLHRYMLCIDCMTSRSFPMHEEHF